MEEKMYLVCMLATAIEMTVAFGCARQLWYQRNDIKDDSRRYLALASFLCGTLALVEVLVNLLATEPILAPQLLMPGLCWFAFALGITMTLYPITVARPGWFTRRRRFFYFLPGVVFGVLLLSFKGNWTLLYTPSDILYNITKPDVLVRLLTIVASLPYCFILLFVPRNYRNSSASSRWIAEYVGALLCIFGIHVALMLTGNRYLVFILPILVSTFLFFSMLFELYERLVPNVSEDDGEEEEEDAQEELMDDSGADQTLWGRILYFIDEKQVWRDPDLTLSQLAQMCGTNVTYLNLEIRRETGSGFKDLINGRRIQDVVSLMDKNPDTDLQEVFFNAGYRSRTTGWRNFKTIMGVSPMEYKLKQ